MKAKDSKGLFFYYEDVDIDYFINNFNKINKLCCFFAKKYLQKVIDRKNIFWRRMQKIIIDISFILSVKQIKTIMYCQKN
jgi:hypothetical protein